MKYQTFDQWHKNHSCDTEELWKIQNLLGSILGWDHPEFLAASKAWVASRKNCKLCLKDHQSSCSCVCHVEWKFDEPEEKGECCQRWTGHVCDKGNQAEKANDPYANTNPKAFEKANQGGCVCENKFLCLPEDNCPCKVCHKDGDYWQEKPQKPSEEERWNALLDMMDGSTGILASDIMRFRKKFL